MIVNIYLLIIDKIRVRISENRNLCPGVCLRFCSAGAWVTRRLTQFVSGQAHFRPGRNVKVQPMSAAEDEVGALLVLRAGWRCKAIIKAPPYRGSGGGERKHEATPNCFHGEPYPRWRFVYVVDASKVDRPTGRNFVIPKAQVFYLPQFDAEFLRCLYC